MDYSIYSLYRPQGDILLQLAEAKLIDSEIDLSMSDDELISRGFYRVVPTEIPECGFYQEVQMCTPIKSDDGKSYKLALSVKDRFTVDIMLPGNVVVTVEDQKTEYLKQQIRLAQSEIKDILENRFKLTKNDPVVFQKNGVSISMLMDMESQLLISGLMNVAAAGQNCYIPTLENNGHTRISQDDVVDAILLMEKTRYSRFNAFCDELDSISNIATIEELLEAKSKYSL